MKLRRAAMGLATVLGIAPRGFFIPYRDAGRLAGRGAIAPYAAIERRFASCHARFEETLDLVDEFGDELEAIGDEPAPAPRWHQDWFPRLDGALAYALVRSRRPRRIVEVGSGHSTRFLARAVEIGGGTCEITCIDPEPRAAIRGLPVRHLETPVQEAGEASFAALAAGDMLVIDSSHVLMPGSDVDFLLNRVLPALAPGVLVHFHDVFLPWPYPEAWAWRGYNEQQAVAALVHGQAYLPLMASRYALARLGERMARGVIGRLPLIPGAWESSLWLEKQ